MDNGYRVRFTYSETLKVIDMLKSKESAFSDEEKELYYKLIEVLRTIQFLWLKEVKDGYNRETS